MKMPSGPESPADDEVARRLRAMTRRGFAWGGASALAALAAWRWVATRPNDQGVPWPLRRVLEFDERVHRAVFGPFKPAPAFPASASRTPRVNGRIGIDLGLNVDAWRLKVAGPGGSKSYTLAEVKALPRVEMTTELKCIEGWSVVVTWAGARLTDLASASGLATRSGRPIDLRDSPGDVMPFASAATPNAAYYVGLEADGAFHPQTLLCYEMNGRPLEPLHGAPLRLAVPIKYGIKSLKQVGSIAFTEARPIDYWAERGYDWFAGH